MIYFKHFVVYFFVSERFVRERFVCERSSVNVLSVNVLSVWTFLSVKLSKIVCERFVVNV